MLVITIPGIELYDENTNEFVSSDPQKLRIEHSLLSISKWEAKWHKPFLSSDKNSEEILDYIKCMTINNVNDDVYYRLSTSNIKDINEYIENPMTATTINDTKRGGSKEIITSELIYYWIISFNIPIECQRWHINRLLTLIKVCNIKNSPPEKTNKQELMNRNKRLNEERRKKLESNG